MAASDEHGKLRVSDFGAAVDLGSKVRLIPGHCDPTVNLWDWYVAYRGDRVEALWPITARGAGMTGPTNLRRLDRICARIRHADPADMQEATAGFEPAIGVLQTPALPLGYVALDRVILRNRRGCQNVKL